MQTTAHHIGSSCQQRKQKNWNHHLYFYISMYIHYMIHVSINFPPSRKMHMKHFSRFTGLAIWAYSFFFQFFRCLHLPSFLPLIFTHKIHSQNTKIIWDHPPSMVHPAWLEAEQQKLAVKHMGRFHRDEISVAEVFLWNACLVNIHEYWVLPCWLRLVVSCNDKVSTTNHLKPLADVCHG